MFWDWSGVYKFSALLWFDTSFFERYVDFSRKPRHQSISVSRFSIKLGQNLNSVGQNRSVCHFQGSISPTGGFGSIESVIFGRPTGYRSVDSCAGPVDQWIWFHRIRDFRSTSGISGLLILVWVALPRLFSNVVSMVGFGTYCALAHEFNKCFQRDF